MQSKKRIKFDPSSSASLRQKDSLESVLSPTLKSLPCCPFARVLSSMLGALGTPVIWRPLHTYHYFKEVTLVGKPWPMPRLYWCGQELDYVQALRLLTGKACSFMSEHPEPPQEGVFRQELHQLMMDVSRHFVCTESIDLTQYWRFPARSALDYEKIIADISRQLLRRACSARWLKSEGLGRKIDACVRKFLELAKLSEHCKDALESKPFSMLELEMIVFSDFLKLLDHSNLSTELGLLTQWASARAKDYGFVLKDLDFHMNAWHTTYLEKKVMSAVSRVDWQIPIWRLVARYFPVIRCGQSVMVNSYDVSRKLMDSSKASVQSVYLNPMKNIVGEFVLGLDESAEASASHEVLKQLFTPFLRQADTLVPMYCERYLTQYFSAFSLGKGRFDLVDVVGVRLAVYILLDQVLGLEIGKDKGQGVSAYHSYNWWASGLRVLFNSIFYQPHNRFLSIKAKQIGLEIQRLLAAHYLNLKKQINQQPALIDIEQVDQGQFVLNVMGVLVGAVETINRSVVHILYPLLNKSELYTQFEHSLQSKNRDETLSFIHEIHRQHPCTPFIKRSFKEKLDIDLQRGGKIREVNFRAGDSVILNLMASNQDPYVISEPRQFEPGQRPYNLQFGSGFHRCFGEKVAENIWLESFRFLFKHFRMERINKGKQVPSYDGPLCEHFWVNILAKQDQKSNLVLV